jgi:malto-oligosyltrehalose trehalohydrolase
MTCQVPRSGSSEAGKNASSTVRNGHQVTKCRHPYGAEILADGVSFRFWAPACDHVELELSDEAETVPMLRTEGGWHELIAKKAVAGSRYRFVLPSGLRVPDPASFCQPEDVHGRSEVVDIRSLRRSTSNWSGRPWAEAVLYELHIGTFSPEGTFQGAIGKLGHLEELGITAIEIMPIADFPGRRNWGYDGVLPFAPDSSYGRPEDFTALIEAAHERGMMVILDVVYNHFGPDGNYLPVYAPQFFTDRHKTPWGPAINFDGEGSRHVRDFIVQNALHWITNFNLDGLRLDAVHAIVDESPVHILQELAVSVREACPGRKVHLILENEDNEAHLLERNAANEPRFYTAQWNDDVHHSLHTAITGEGGGYYGEYYADPKKLARSIAEGFAFQGEVMAYRGAARGEPSSHLPPSAFVAFIQNHDQIGNRAFGDRIGATARVEALRAGAAVYLLLPQTPLIFMGEEWNCRSPFPFFCDFGDQLADAVRNGRREEFARFPEFQNPEQREQIPDPQDDATFASAKLCWDEAEGPEQRKWLEWYRRILAARQRSIVPVIPEIDEGARFQMLGPGAMIARWSLRRGNELVVAANLSGTPRAGFPVPNRPPIWQEGPTASTMEPWSVVWWTTA